MAGSYRSRVAGTGSYLPEKILSNADLEKMVDTNDQWIMERTGIKNRHITADNQTNSDLCYEASVKALRSAGMTAQDIDLILVATISGDYLMPSTACMLQQKLGARHVMAFDIAAACTGFLYGITIADQFIRTGMYKNVLVVGAEVLHRYIDYTDRDTCILFGDGAGAWVLSRTDESDPNVIMGAHLKADGNLADLLILQAGGSSMPLTEKVFAEKSQYMKMKGREIFKNAARTMGQCSEEALRMNGKTAAEVDWMVPHQANVRIIEAVANQFNFPMEKVILSLHETGNTSAASIPLAFEFGLADGRIKRGQLIMLTAFGAGLTSGSLLLRY